MKTSLLALGLSVLLPFGAVPTPVAVHAAPVLPADVASALARGGLVLVLRHAHAPQAPPAPEAAAPGNTTPERQLDARGEAEATAIGRGLRAVGARIDRVLVSPAFRARQTASFAGFAEATASPELGDNAKSMAGVTDAQARWLRARAAEAPGQGHLLLITHAPNLTRAFPEWGGSVAEGELVILRPGADGPAVLARVLPGQW